jgi:stage III sporulation protein AD
MDLIRIGVMGIISAVLIVLIKNQKPEIGLQISLVFGAVVMVTLAGRIKTILDLISLYFNRADMSGAYITSLFKIIGMAYITEFAAESCRDASQGSIAAKVELAGKVMIMITPFPTLQSVL